MGRQGWGRRRGRNAKWGGGWGSRGQGEVNEQERSGAGTELIAQLSERARWVAREERLGACHAILEARYLISPHRGLLGSGGVTQLTLAIAQRSDPYPNLGLCRSGRSRMPCAVDSSGEALISRRALLELAQRALSPGLDAQLRLGAVVDATCSFWDDGLLIERPSEDGALELVDMTRWSELKEVKMSARSAKGEPDSSRKAYLLTPEGSYNGEGKLLASERFLELLKPHALAHGISVRDCGSGPFAGGRLLNEAWARSSRQVMV